MQYKSMQYKGKTAPAAVSPVYVMWYVETTCRGHRQNYAFVETEVTKVDNNSKKFGLGRNTK